MKNDDFKLPNIWVITLTMKETWVPMVVGTYNESFCKLVLAGPPQLGKKNNLLTSVKNDHFRRCVFFRDFFSVNYSTW